MDFDLDEALAMQQIFDQQRAAAQQESAEAHRAAMRLQAMMADPFVQAIEQWYPDERAADSQRISGWHALRDEANTDDFRRFLARLPETADYQDPARRPALVQRIVRLLDTLRSETPALREQCYLLAADGLTNCGDRVALTLNDIDIAIINHRAENGSLTEQDLFRHRRGMFRHEIVNRLAQEKINALERQGRVVDPVEVRLGYQTRLAGELELPGVGQSMLYGGLSDITPDDLDRAREMIRRDEGWRGFTRFIAEWQPWQQMLQRTRPAAFEDAHRMLEIHRDGLVEQPAFTSAMDYDQMYRELATFEATLFNPIYERLTREWLGTFNSTT